MPINRVAIKKALKGIRKRATGFVLLAILFLVVGLAQYGFVSHQIRATTVSELNLSAGVIANEIYKDNHWDIVSYRQAFFSTSSWYVFSADGMMIDNEAPVPGLLNMFSPVKFPTNFIYESPHTITSEVGGTYRVLTRSIQGGVVVVAFDIEVPTNSPCGECLDQKLEQNLERFGQTLDEAANVSPREVDEDLNYAVISQSGELKSGLGEVPLKINTTAVLAAAESHRLLRFDDTIYLLVSRPILNSANKIAGTIVVPSDITLQQRAINAHLKFDLFLSIFTFVIAVLIAVYFVGRELARDSHFENLPEALLSPENLRKEFKSSFQWDIGCNCKNPDERIKTFKTIVAFLNSEGGVLFIGVNDNRTIRGIKEDLDIFNGSTDKFLLQVGDLIADRIGAEFSPLIEASCEPFEGKTVCVIKVQKAIEPAFFKDNSKSHFYTREGNRTHELDPKETNAFIRSKRWDK